MYCWEGKKEFENFEAKEMPVRSRVRPPTHEHRRAFLRASERREAKDRKKKKKKDLTRHKFRVLYQFRGESFDTTSDSYKHLKGWWTRVTSAREEKTQLAVDELHRMLIEAQRTINN